MTEFWIAADVDVDASLHLGGDPAPRVLALARSREPGLGAHRLICVDGRSGSGKTSLAERLGAPVIHLDELLAGWEGGLPRMVDALVTDVLEPLAHGRPAAYHRWDWLTGRFAEWVPVPPTPWLVVEGAGAGSRACAAYASALVWVEAPMDERKRRALDRDGETFAPFWDSWAALEREHFAREGTRERADLIVRTSAPPAPRV